MKVVMFRFVLGRCHCFTDRNWVDKIIKTSKPGYKTSRRGSPGETKLFKNAVESKTKHLMKS